VLGNVISSGVKVLVLAVVVGIGSTLFSQFTSGFGGNQPTIENAVALVLAALSLLGLGIFGPGIANGIVSGGPQLGAGAAVGTTMAAGGVVAAGAALTAGGASLTSSMVGGAARGGSALIGGAASGYRTGAQAGETGACAASPLRSLAARLGRSNAAGDEAGGADASSASAPAWVRRMKRAQTVSHGVSATTQALRSGDHGGGGASVDLKDSER
jgi:type IV secretion system protein TrbL